MDRPHDGPAGPARTSDATVTARVAAYADREVVVRDGKVSTLTGAKP